MKSDAIIGAVQGVTKKWQKQRKREERQSSARINRRHAMTRRYHVSIKEAASEAMEEAYMKASDNGRLPAHARQVMYAARPSIQQMADSQIGKGFDKYFSQTLLPDYMEAHDLSEKWNVVFDARGNFHEPHTGVTAPLGTLQVRNYLSCVRGHSVDDLDFSISEKRFPTMGPDNRYGAILFIEKEGFMPLFREVKLVERYDLAIMSTKGMSVTASRELVDELCAGHDIPLLILHDFDKSGFSIAGTLQRDTRRYRFRNEIRVIDLGLRLADIDGLETENVYFKEHHSVRRNLRQNGASKDEIEFLLHRRVELNAFTSNELVTWIEGKLTEHGITKVVPDEDTLIGAYRRARKQAVVQARIDDLLDDLDDVDHDPDASLKNTIRERLSSNPEMTWDEAIRDLAMADHDEATR